MAPILGKGAFAVFIVGEHDGVRVATARSAVDCPGQPGEGSNSLRTSPTTDGIVMEPCGGGNWEGGHSRAWAALDCVGVAWPAVFARHSVFTPRPQAAGRLQKAGEGDWMFTFCFDHIYADALCLHVSS